MARNQISFKVRAGDQETVYFIDFFAFSYTSYTNILILSVEDCRMADGGEVLDELTQPQIDLIREEIARIKSVQKVGRTGVNLDLMKKRCDESEEVPGTALDWTGEDLLERLQRRTGQVG